MKFWNFIGEFFLLRWLFGKVEAINDNLKDSESCRYNHNLSSRNYYCDNDYDWNNQSYNDFHDEQDDYDMMDDDF
ncbi:MAG: hypothetical protein K2I89_08790 [Muribaculaceae bacterium]|nr:hypothetical protein [Muribaculaceae bacterium]